VQFNDRVRTHAALGDPHRLVVVDALRYTDLTFSELKDVTGLESNALAHHLDVLESTRLISRRASEGDRRQRYVRLEPERLDALATATATTLIPSHVLFVCTHNSARSQFAAARWDAATGQPAMSAGTTPAERVHPTAVRVAGEFGLDLTSAEPRGYDSVRESPDLVISVCDRAKESWPRADASRLHWSIPDPVAAGNDDAFRRAFSELCERIDRLTGRTSNSTID
jgi:protein-tyrosine-phosphatase/DNA-binding transcriptional ArsR family regulator